jgi:hypothetical protein
MDQLLSHAFASPGAAYRGKPFWAWNGKLTPEELRRQIREMHHMGLGGFFMHSRVGLATPYLSEEWFTCINACLDEATTLGMEAWLYDEDRWPSGAAGGLVTKNPAYRMRSLKMYTLTDPGTLTWDVETLAVFTAYVEGDQARDVVQLAHGAQPMLLAAGQVLLRFAVELEQPSSWFNGYTYLDTLNHEAVQQFIAVTHEAYRRECAEHFGKVLPGIFADEPNHGSMLGQSLATLEPRSLPWTAKLPEVYLQRYGEALLPHLVELVFDVDGQAVSPARYQYHDCVTHLFVDAFARQIGEWCEQNQLQFTGHVLAEETLSSQTMMVGNCMRFYEHMQAPGMDLLTEHWSVFDTAKQVSSAARQFGRTWRLTETYGCTGWDFPFAGHKALGDWQVALGINVRCQHLAWYTMLGEAKRDYPAAIFYQSPWAEFYPKVEDYFARVLAVMTRGTEVRDLLVIHPIESAWLLCKNNWAGQSATRDYDLMLEKLGKTLLAGHVDFDYGDEEILARLAEVRTTEGAATFVVNQAAYTAVLVPPLITMRASTLALLQRFAQAGGTVIFAGEPARYVDARPSATVMEFAQSCPHGVPVQGDGLVQAVEGTCRRLAITDAAGHELAPVLYLLREDDEAMYLFLCNYGEDFAHTDRAQMGDTLVRDRTLDLPEVVIRGFAGCAGAPLLLDPETGAMTRANATRTAAGWEIHTSLPPLASRVYVMPKQALTTADLPMETTLTAVRTLPLTAERWQIQLSEQNPLVLDRPRYRINQGAWQPETEILRIDRAVRDALGVKHRGGDMVQPWAQPRAECEPSLHVSLAYGFDVAALPSGQLTLGIEQPQTFRITLNGTEVDTASDCGWWTDRSLRLLQLDPALLHIGHNEMIVDCAKYTPSHSGLEIIYLLGQFGAYVQDTRITMTEPPHALTIGDWVTQGLAFYAGSVIYRQVIAPPVLAPDERLFVRVPEYRGVGVRVLVNGQQAGVIGWEPNEVDITAFVGSAPVTVQIEVIGHRRNSHGPHHLNEQWPGWTGPESYQAGDDRWFEGYQLVPCGMMADPQLVVKRNITDPVRSNLKEY